MAQNRRLYLNVLQSNDLIFNASLSHVKKIIRNQHSVNANAVCKSECDVIKELVYMKENTVIPTLTNDNIDYLLNDICVH